MKEKILIVNDDDDVRSITSLFLQAQDYEISEAAGGQEALNKAINEKPDLILLDILMPNMDGYETCQRLKAEAKTKEIPVIFLSTLTSPKDKIRGLEVGAIDFITNIVDRGELLARVKTHLKIKFLTEALMNTNQELLRKQNNLNENLRAAAMIQRSFLPAENLKMKNVELASFWLPANILGGDIFNAMTCGKNKMILYMIDVSGHDVPSALCTISVSQFLQQKSTRSVSILSPKKMLHLLNRNYPLERFDRYFTIFYLVLNLDDGNIIYSCAGHPPAIILKKDKSFRLLDSGTTIIGLDGKNTLEEWAETLEDGDKVILYTDGIETLKNKKGEYYGIDKFYSLLESSKQQPINEIVNIVQKSLTQFSEEISERDDISLIGFEYKKGLI